MIRNRLIVCIASCWDYDPTSKHHLMRILSRENKVLWINYHGTRRPGISRWDARDCISAVLRVAQGLRQVTTGLWQLTPLVIPGTTGPLLGKIHQRLLIEQIDRAKGVLDPQRSMPVQIWTFAPDVHFLGGALGEERFVYYCVDEYTKFQGFDSAVMAELEAKLLRRADVVIATSKPLCEAKRKIRAGVELVPHGVDYEHFASAWRKPLPAPPDMREIPRPIFGFFGLIHHWFDVELLARVASLRPHYSFVLIGDCKIDSGLLSGLPNVHLLGRKDYATLPAYCATFSAGLLPFVRNEMTQCINPIKLTEYLAAGLPVISTAIPAAEEFGGQVAIARTAEEFARYCDAALKYAAADRAKISERVRAHTWEARVETVSQLVSHSVRSAARAEIEPKPVDAPVRSGYGQTLKRLVIHPAG